MVEHGERSIDEVRARGLVPTGLQPAFPTDARCPGVASSFANTTRYDGSRRAPFAMFGLHQGMDISLPVGTPIIAIASGTLVHKRKGPLLVGNEIFVRHSPDDTGLPVWTFAKYKHFDKLPDIAAGQKVTVGQVIGLSGNTGTTGGYYGAKGYPHLHLSVYWNEDGGYKVNQGRLSIDNPRYVDPLALYLGRGLDSATIQKLPASEKRVTIPYKTSSGAVFPQATKALWPVICTVTSLPPKT